MLADWFATALFWKPQVVFLVNQRTFVPVFITLAPAATVLDRAPDTIAAVLRCHGADDASVGEARIAPTNDRSVVGVMNELAVHGQLRWQDGIDTFEDLSIELAGMPLGPLRSCSGSPDRELAAVLGLEPGCDDPVASGTPAGPSVRTAAVRATGV